MPQRASRVVIAPPGGLPREEAERAGREEGKTRLVRLEKRPPRAHQAAVESASGEYPGLRLGWSASSRLKRPGCRCSWPTCSTKARPIARLKKSPSTSIRSARFATASGRNTVYTSASVLRDDFPQAAAIVAECFLHPTFPRDQFEKVKALTLGAIASRSDDPQAEAMEMLADALPAASPYHIVLGGKADTVGPMKVDDLRAYHALFRAAEHGRIGVWRH